jgi:hypothetical protein
MRPPSPPSWLAPALFALLAVAGLSAVWLAMTGALRQTYYGSANGVAGELVEGRTAGQTFRAQHDGLSAVDLQLATYSHTLGGVVVLHLRQDVTHTVDLATVRLPGAAIADNAWTRFAFPPIPNSRGQSYYVELEHQGGRPGAALTVYWWLGAGDPYPYGRATLDRAPQDGDLTFGLRYDPPPGALLADMLSAFAAGVPRRPLALFVLAALALPVLLAVMLAGARRGWFDGAPKRRARLGALLTLFALAHGYVYLLATPPWQGPDEFAHYAYSALLAAGVRGDDTSPQALAVRARIEQNIEAAMDARGFTRTVSWYATPGGPASGFVAPASLGGSTMFFETRQPALYYQLGAGLLRLYTADPAALPADIGLYLVRGVSVLCNAIVVLVAWVAALVIAPGPRRRAIWLALPLAVALLPMRAFIDSMANNDPLAEVAVSLVALTVFVWLTRQRPFGRAGLIAAGAGFVLLAPALLTKTTTATAGLALWVSGAPAAVALTLARTPAARKRAGWLIACVCVAGVAAVGALFVSSYDGQNAAQGWFLDAGVRAWRAPAPDAHGGGYVLRLGPGQITTQRLDLPADHPAYTVQFRIWLRPAAGFASGQTDVTLDARGGVITATRTTFAWTAPTAAWQPVTATAMLPAGIPALRLVLIPSAGVEADDASLTLAPSAQPGAAQPAALRNPSMEEAGLQLQTGSPLARLLAKTPEQLNAALILDTLLNPQGFSRVALAREFIDNAYRSYWGWFGWLSGPTQLPEWQFGVITLAALAGLLGWGFAILRRRAPGARVALAFASALALIVAGAIAVIRQITLFAAVGLRDFPQGRYLFVLIIPTMWALLAGWQGWLPPPESSTERARGRSVPQQAGVWLGALGLASLVFFDLYALLVIIGPYYYGRF